MKTTGKKKLKLVNVEEISHFWVNGGPVLKNLVELRDSLIQMSKDTFSYHVNKEKNDFANWIKEALRDETLSKKLAKTKTLKATIKAIEDRLKKYDA